MYLNVDNIIWTSTTLKYHINHWNKDQIILALLTAYSNLMDSNQ